jgi:hypothetical protein
MIKSARFACAGLLLSMVGCVVQNGVGVITYEKGTGPILAKATADGEYSLYAKNAADPKVSYLLHAGDPLGFKVGQTGQILAVGGKDEIAVPDEDYVWKRR